jgi:uncharacterized protein (TIGR02452 family)
VTASTDGTITCVGTGTGLSLPPGWFSRYSCHMGTFTSNIARSAAMQLGEETVHVGENGVYTSPSGRRVDIKAEVQAAAAGTRSYPPDAVLPERLRGDRQTRMPVANETTLSAARRLLATGLNTAVLNLASASHPGCGFLSGARAQEEYLARATCLYQCIRDNPMYENYREGKAPLYSDPFKSFFMIYSPKVPVIRGDNDGLLENPELASIITAAAVNAKRVPEDQKKAIPEVMWRRILKVLAVGLAQGHDALVLGAWGCGAFGLDGAVISGLFRRGLDDNFRGAYQEIVFAIVDWSPEKRFIGPFERTFRV